MIFSTRLVVLLMVVSCKYPRPPDVIGAGEDAPVMCVPQTVEDCFDGPAAQRGVGECVDGVHTCNSTGDGFSECTGQTLAKVEVCGGTSEVQDDNCDGVPQCTGATHGSVFTSEGDVTHVDVGVDGSRFVLGRYDNAFSIGGMGLPPGEQGETMLVKLDGNNTPVWAQGFAGLGHQFSADVIAMSDGGAVIAVYFSTSGSEVFHVGAANLTSPNVGQDDVFVARVDTDGQIVWVGEFDITEGFIPFNGENGTVFLAPGPADSTYVHFSVGNGVSGALSYTAPTGTVTPLTSDPNFLKLHLLKLGADGALIAQTAIESPDSGVALVARGLTVESTGNLVLAGFNPGSDISFPDSVNIPTGEFMFRIAAPPSFTAIKGMPSPGPVTAMASDRSGQSFATGTVGGASSRPFLVRVTSGGGVFDIVTPTSTGASSGRGVAVDAANQVVLVGTCNGAVDFSPGVAGGDHNTTADDICAAKYKADGTLLWSRNVNASGNQSADAVLPLALGDLVVMGGATGSVTFADTPIVIPGSYLMTLRP